MVSRVLNLSSQPLLYETGYIWKKNMNNWPCWSMGDFTTPINSTPAHKAWPCFWITGMMWSIALPQKKCEGRSWKNVIVSSLWRADLLAPIPHPTSCRDGYAFRQHVAAARQNRNVEMIPEFDQYPIFYFTNHNSIQGPGPIYCMPDHFNKLDFELEAAVVINRAGRNIKADEADDYIAGLMIMNDMKCPRITDGRNETESWSGQRKRFRYGNRPHVCNPGWIAAFEIPAKKGIPVNPEPRDEMLGLTACRKSEEMWATWIGLLPRLSSVAAMV